MKLDKAIEIQSDSAYGGSTTFNQDFKDSQKLGIEALKRIQRQRKDLMPSERKLLPGETEE